MIIKVYLVLLILLISSVLAMAYNPTEIDLNSDNQASQDGEIVYKDSGIKTKESAIYFFAIILILIIFQLFKKK